MFAAGGLRPDDIAELPDDGSHQEGARERAAPGTGGEDPQRPLCAEWRFL